MRLVVWLCVFFFFAFFVCVSISGVCVCYCVCVCACVLLLSGVCCKVGWLVGWFVVPVHIFGAVDSGSGCSCCCSHSR